jgi:hypothetical protein
MDKSAESATSHASGIQLIACLLRRDFKVDREGRESNGLRTGISTSVRLFEAGHVQALLALSGLQNDGGPDPNSVRNVDLLNRWACNISFCDT